MSKEKKRNYKTFTPQDLDMAVFNVQEGKFSLWQAAKWFGIPLGTLSNKGNHKHMKPAGRQQVFTEEEELTFAQHLSTVADWGFPWDRSDLAYMVKAYLDRLGRKVTCFADNYPGIDWIKSFLKRNREHLVYKKCQNLKPEKAKITPEVVTDFFDLYEETVDGISPNNIWNFDETGLADDPGVKKCFFPTGDEVSRKNHQQL